MNQRKKHIRKNVHGKYVNENTHGLQFIKAHYTQALSIIKQK